MADDVKKLAGEVAAGMGRRRRTSKSNRTLALSEPQFTEFQKYCQMKGVYASDVVDRLISVFMRESMVSLPAPAPGGPSQGADGAGGE